MACTEREVVQVMGEPVRDTGGSGSKAEKAPKHKRIGPAITYMVVAMVLVSIGYALRGPFLGIGPTLGPAQTADVQVQLLALKDSLALHDSVIGGSGARDGYRQRVEEIYRMRNLPDSLRVVAALAVAEALAADQAFDGASDWARLAYALVPDGNTDQQAKIQDIIESLQPTAN